MEHVFVVEGFCWYDTNYGSDIAVFANIESAVAYVGKQIGKGTQWKFTPNPDPDIPNSVFSWCRPRRAETIVIRKEKVLIKSDL